MDLNSLTKNLETVQIPYSQERKDALFHRLLEERNRPSGKKQTRFTIAKPSYQWAFGLVLFCIITGSYYFWSTRPAPTTPTGPDRALLERIQADTAKVENAVQKQSVVGTADGVTVYQLEDGRIAMAPNDLKTFIESHSPYEREKEISKYKMNETVNLFYHTNTRVVELVAGEQETLYIDISKLF
jgi:zona occludens toxin (predicted ATPase)